MKTDERSTLVNRVPMPSADPRPFTADDDIERRFEAAFKEVDRRVIASLPTADTGSGDTVVTSSNQVMTISGRRTNTVTEGFNTWFGEVTFPSPFALPPSVQATAEEIDHSLFLNDGFMTVLLYNVTTTGFQFRLNCNPLHYSAAMNWRAEGRSA